MEDESLALFPGSPPIHEKVWERGYWKLCVKVIYIMFQYSLQSQTLVYVVLTQAHPELPSFIQLEW